MAAFCGEQCRGYAFVKYEADFDKWIYYLNAYGESGHSFTFKLYDHQTNKELNYLTSPDAITYNTDGVGYPWDPYILNFTGEEPSPTYELPITGYGSGNGNWYFISSPIGDVATGDVQGLTTGTFDLYSFDQNSEMEWINMHNGGTLQAGKGYLYANSANTTLTFSGEAYTGTGEFPLVYSTSNSDETMHGWNLVGNPFAQPASVGDRAFYVMNETGSEIIVGSGNVPAMNGIFVKATAAGESVTFTPNGTNTGSKIALNLVRNDRSASLVDRAVVRFDEGGQLPKFMLDATNTRVYIPQDGANYAVANHNSDNNTAVSFKAKENGSYTLKVSVENLDLEYLHLIDNQTGTDVDLLATPSYTFDANTTDQADRFRLVYAETTGIDENNNFAYFNGKTWNVNNEGQATLQVMDITGRTISSQTISGNAELTLDQPAGVYVLRLINGNDTKVQKVVVR